MITNVAIKDKKGTEHVMSVDTYARWLCLMEALQFINKKGAELSVDMNHDDSWIKPIKINKYIEERYPSLRHDVGIEDCLDF